MTDENREQIDARTGMPPIEGEDESIVLGGEESKSEESTEEKTEEESKEDSKEEEKTEEKLDDSKSEDKSEEDKNKDDDDSKTTEEKQTVPYGKLKSEIKKRHDLENTLADKVAEGVKSALMALAEAGKEVPDPVKKAAEEIAEQTGLGADGAESILRKATELISKNKGEIPEEVSKAIKDLQEKNDQLLKDKEARDAKDRELAEATFFNEEWGKVSDVLKKEYPAVTESMLSEAKKKMDELAHSETYGRVKGKHDAYSLDYILYKEKKTFDTLLKVAPKDKGTEVSKTIGLNKEEEAEDTPEKLVPVENLTPAIMKKRDQEEIDRRKQKDNQEYHDMEIIDPIE